jgi:hypothetical protein
MSLPPANWYPSPDDASRERWWDGTSWSDHYRASSQLPAYGAQATPYAQPNPYGLAGYQYGAAVAPKNGLAIAGFVVSLVSLLIGLYTLVPIAGIVLSGVGLARAQRARATGGVATGYGMALAGVIVGVASFIGNVIWLAYLGNS